MTAAARLPRIYFYCRNDDGNLQEDILALAQGFRELGIPYHSSCDYWQESVGERVLLRHDPDVTPDDCDVVVVSYTWPYWIRMKTFDLVRRPLPDGLFKSGRRYATVYMDSHDGHRTVSWEPEFRQFDLILRTKLNRRAWRPGNMKAWAYGLTNHICRATAGATDVRHRRTTILMNFGASHPYPHGTRTLAQKVFDPRIAAFFEVDSTRDDLSQPPVDAYEALMWRQTGQRFSNAYYARLKASRAIACFCGELIPPMPFRNPECYLVGGRKAKLRRLFYETLALVDPRPRRSVQWDSFRFWEALAARCVAFNIDLDRYGVELPVMPENWKHYIGVNFDRLDDFFDRLGGTTSSLPAIGQAGHDWAMRHYSPRAVAARFLEYAGYDVRALGLDHSGHEAVAV